MIKKPFRGAFILSLMAGVFMLLFAASSILANTGTSACIIVEPNKVIDCPYHPLSKEKHNYVFLDMRTGHTRAADINNPSAPADIILDPLPAKTKWSPGVYTGVSPNGKAIIVSRSHMKCAPFPKPKGTACSYGRPVAWLALHVPDSKTALSGGAWRHINLAYSYGLNSEIHNWSTWLHEDMALFNGLVKPKGKWAMRQQENNAQIYAVKITNNSIQVKPYAPAQILRKNCLTGRVSAQPSTQGKQCFDGQRLSIVRRCYNEPNTAENWAWWNNKSFDGTGGACLAGMGTMSVPVLKTYVTELDENCVPKQSFEQMKPVRKPPTDNIYRQLGHVPEWGDMLAAISPDGKYIAVATNMGNIEGDPDNACGGFYYSLADGNNPASGNAARQTHYCALDSDLTCKGDHDSMTMVPTTLHPPESTPAPDFVTLNDGSMSLLYNFYWNQTGGKKQTDWRRLDFMQNPPALVNLDTMTYGASISAIHWRAQFSE